MAGARAARGIVVAWSGPVALAVACVGPPHTDTTPATDTETESTSSSTDSGTTAGTGTTETNDPGTETGVTDPSGSSCGDGVRDPGEACDDGNASDEDECLNDCTLAACGDGFVHDGVEECDDGNDDNTDDCIDTCVSAVCGDGFVHAGVEECDDGNDHDDDGCTTTCKDMTPETCGDGQVQPPEECDDGNDDNTDMCTAWCKNNVCGDGYPAFFEQCDDGNADNTDDCLDDCTPASCGDGFVHVGVEECDDANDVDSDSCLSDCTSATCGDGIVHEGAEVCDDGFNDGAYNGCQRGCGSLGPHCGDGAVNGPEECDDGNTDPGDGCDSTCAVELPPECTDYVELSAANRHESYNDGGDLALCDTMADGNWHRFVGQAGTKMPTAAPPVYSCGTEASGWMKGSYPSIADGVVDREVCFAFLWDTCTWSTMIKVRKCDAAPAFFVFKLPDPPECNLRYCGAD